ncbi:hypothetical protein DXG03_000432 [Asterophora parasitica]|uniref:Uncharacterized protein n=1 Tax=Asterophora parasitica TaxID=117018 RepID=A0A9P7GBB6_9AGAR|nr:hypothetical protein DXG03_000432 [Asterophora parasitica]
MATPTKPERRFFGDLTSLRSFGGTGSSSSPPSLKTSSLKVKKTVLLPIPRILGRRRWLQSGESGDFNVTLRGGISNQDFNTPAPKPSRARHKPEAMTSTHRPREVSGTENTNTTGQSKAEKSQRPSTRSKRVIRLISMKFRGRSPSKLPSSPSPHPRPPMQTSDLASKEKREAALRERGLLPPLKSNADLSRAEQERDRHIPILPTPSSDEILAIDGEVRKVSAASKVKQEWEAKNKVALDDDDQRERMKAFKFGALTSSPIPKDDTISKDDVSTPLVTFPSLLPAEEVEIPFPSLDAAPQSPILKARSESGSSRPPSLRSKLSLPPAKEEEHGLVVLVSAPSEPHLVPLPPSPVLPATMPREIFGDELATSVPLPPSPNPSIRSLTLHTPTLSQRTPSETSSLSTITTSPTTTSPTSRLNALTVAVYEDKIPIIVESPIEESSVKGSILAPILSRDHFTTAIQVTLANDIDDTTAEADADDEPFISTSTSPSASASPAQKPRPRNFTDPPPTITVKVPTPKRRKSLNLFKRALTLSPNPSSTDPANPNRSRRLSMSASMNNIRRSVIGTLTRPSNPTTPRTDTHHGFNASHLPPSPTIPAAFADQAALSPNPSPPSPHSPSFPNSPGSPRWNMRLVPGAHRPPPQELKSRLAVSPTLHSRGSILVETNNIEDEESRRVTELAFLG